MVGGWNGVVSGSIKCRMIAGRHLGKLWQHHMVSRRQHGFLVLTIHEGMKHKTDVSVVWASFAYIIVLTLLH